VLLLLLLLLTLLPVVFPAAASSSPRVVAGGFEESSSRSSSSSAQIWSNKHSCRKEDTREPPWPSYTAAKHPLASTVTKSSIDSRCPHSPWDTEHCTTGRAAAALPSWCAAGAGLLCLRIQRSSPFLSEGGAVAGGLFSAEGVELGGTPGWPLPLVTLIFPTNGAYDRPTRALEESAGVVPAADGKRHTPNRPTAEAT